MGKASKWFRGLLGLKKSDPNPKPAHKKKWSLAKSHKENDGHKSPHDNAFSSEDNDNDASKRAISVAAAVAAVAPAQAIAAVIKLTKGEGNTSTTWNCGGSKYSVRVSKTGGRYVNREEWAAVTIQSHFRAYLSRRALRALKALVKLQALVRGQIVRKQTTCYLRQMQAHVRAQARAMAGRVLISEAPQSSALKHTGPATPEKTEHMARASSVKHKQPMTLKRDGSKSSGNIIYDPEESRLSSHLNDKRMSEQSRDRGSNFSPVITVDVKRSGRSLELDTGRPHVAPKRGNIFHSSHLISHDGLDEYRQSFSIGGEVQSLSPLNLGLDVDDGSAFYTAENSPHLYSASSMGGRRPFAPAKSDGSRSGYSDHPNYMAYTESSRAKVRSLSTPKQRHQYERSSSMNGYSSRVCQKVSSTLRANFRSKAYPGSGRLDAFEMPVKGNIAGFSGGHYRRY